MKILMIVDNYLDFIKSQAEAISKVVEEVHVIMVVPKMPSWMKIKYYAQYKDERLMDLKNKPNNVLIHKTKYFETTIKNLFFANETIKKAEEIILKNKIDIIHAHFIRKNGFIGSKLKNITKKPLIITIHENHDWYRSILEKPNKQTIKILKNANKIIRVNDKDTNYLTRIVKEDKVVCIPNGFSKKKFNKFSMKKTKQLKKKLKIAPNKKIILSIGLLSKRKDHIGVLKAINKLGKNKKEYQIIIIGDGKEYPKLNAFSKYNKLDVKFVKHVPYDEMVNWYNVSDVFCSMSKSESFGMVYLEALACKVPIITMKNTGAEFVLKNGELGSICSNYLELSKIIKRKKYFTSKKSNEEIKKYEWKNISSKIYKVYKEIK